ncbi:hypothetical protein AMATHDRAFT_152976 [Amanita thiersii Skay4041]|uniref:cAMP-independent regulatory protein pac2 n=1 Tax=Amanita thiersii Skay4041 TaxID=703135 RepID=A0A2A9NFQ5_9AGAR|nr:hypothetical protein AMATHDRAFT_152976 [Amanita thiersii Skay4041]
MQLPTLQNVRIRSTRDALQVFYGVALNRLPLITRRLDAEERRAIVAGNVYVWEERGANTEPSGLGMERWTDGMGWGPSPGCRFPQEFLFYHQKESDATEELINPVTPWAQMMRKRDQPLTRSPNKDFSDQQQASEPERLIKQTYSIHVYLPADRPRGIVRKWHLTAYFSQQKLAALQTIDTMKGVGDVTVPEGWFRSARAVKIRRDSRSYGVMPPHLDPTFVPVATHSLCDTAGAMTPILNHYGGRDDMYPLRHCTPSSSTLSDHGSSPSSPTAQSKPLVSRLVHGPSHQLVPLEYLQTVPAPRRDPVDEQILRRFS